MFLTVHSWQGSFFLGVHSHHASLVRRGGDRRTHRSSGMDPGFVWASRAGPHWGLLRSSPHPHYSSLRSRTAARGLRLV